MKKIHIFWIAALCFSVLLSACDSGYEISTNAIPMEIGETIVELVVHESAAPGLTYFNLHDNENTSVKAALDVIRQYGGRLYELKHSGTRNIVFYLDDVRYEFDPNRIFTESGCRETLERYGPVNDLAINEVGFFAENLINQINPADLGYIVTLHNNTRGGYSILSYSEGGDYAAEASQVFTGDNIDPDDFYFITDQVLYEKLRAFGLNVVLQDNENMTDDGSLSVWSAQNHIPYVNIEAQNGHRRYQKSMILFLHDLFPPDQ